MLGATSLISSVLDATVRENAQLHCWWQRRVRGPLLHNECRITSPQHNAGYILMHLDDDQKEECLLHQNKII